MLKFLKRSLIGGSLAAVLGVTAVVAQQQPSDMMQGQGMMPMMGMMQQMSKMMEICNTMMQAGMNRTSPTAPPDRPQNQQ